MGGVKEALSGFLDASDMLRSGVYVLLLRGEVQYVGQAKSVLLRVYQHKDLWAQAKRGTKMPSYLRQKGVQFDQLYVKHCPPDRVASLERELIQRLRPKHNVLLQPPPQGGFVAIEVMGMKMELALKPQTEFVRRF